MSHKYKDFYGCTSTIIEACGVFTLTVWNGYGRITHLKSYKTFRGARIAQGRLSDGWREVA